jgi:hypothetical protein
MRPWEPIDPVPKGKREMRERFLDPTAWKRTTDGWRLVLNGHTIDLCEGPPGFFTPIVDWRTNLTPFPGAACADLRAAVEYTWPLVADTIQRAAKSSVGGE